MKTGYLNIFLRGLLLTVLIGILPTSTFAAPSEITHISVSANEIQAKNDFAFTQLDLYPNIETIGVVISGDDLPKIAKLMYRQNNENTWRTGHPLMRISDGRLVGSLFDLSPATTYSIKVLSGTTEISASITTQPEELQFAPSAILHVDGNAAPGGNGSVFAPFQTIQDGINHAAPGTQVLVADGIYHEAITFPASGSAGNWIQVIAQGNNAVLNGSKTFSGDIWKPYTKAKVWFTKVETPLSYLARDQQRSYNYASLRDLLNDTTGEGWYIERDTLKLYVRSQDDPSKHTWQIPRLNHAFNMDAQDWLWIEGFEMQFYGAEIGGCGICTTNASHIVVRKNRIHNIQLGIFINWTGGNERGNDTRIEYNEIYDPSVNEWAWDAIKGSSMEGTAIVLRGHIGAIVRGNELHNFFNGIYTGSSAASVLNNPEMTFDVDVYDNHIHHISDDALEPEGACVNHRFRNNTIDSSFIGLSLAPITIGPTWVLYSTFSNYTGRGIKWADDSDGIVLIYQNTFWTTAQDIAAMDFITPAHNATLRNNIFENKGYAIYEVLKGSYNHDWDNNNWRSVHSPPIIWEGLNFSDLTTFCAATGLDCNSHAEPSGLNNPNIGDFTLSSSSPNIDQGIAIAGINDGFNGNAPDIGAYEYRSSVTLPPMVSSILRADPNPSVSASVNFTIAFSEPVTGLNTSPPFDDLALTTSPSIIGASITSITAISTTAYSVSVNTGSGSGSIRLDLLDDNTILNATGVPLGGANISDGNFNTGETYTIARTTLTLPQVTGSLRLDLTPTSADKITFSVTFSEEVNGVDANDFVLTATGNISGAVLTNINGAGNNYAISVFSGYGEGTLRLDILDDDSITNQTGIPLGGIGVGNGNFDTGEIFTLDKVSPLTTKILRSAPNPTTTDYVTFKVGFTENVSGVDTNDFAITATGNITGAAITSVSGSDNMYTVTAGTGNGNGTLRLDILDNDSIVDALGNPLGGLGTGNGNFSTGEEYTINKPAMEIITAVFTSNGKNDGWILESSENSEQGGATNAKSESLVIGDNNQNSQYRSILDFPTRSLPNNIVITDVMLMVKKYDMTGTDLFTTHQNILVDIQYGGFGFIGPFQYRGLQSADFQSPSCQDAAGIIQNTPMGDWYWAFLDSTALNCINRYGITQFRLRFQIDDNNDMTPNFLRFYSGDYKNSTYRPRLLIKYYKVR